MRSRPGTVAHADAPLDGRLSVTVEAGLRIPGLAPRIALVVVSCGAFLVASPVPAAVAVLCAIGGALRPSFPAAWGAIVVVLLTRLGTSEDPTAWQPYVALALAHLLHVVASLTTVVDRRGTMQARILARPLLRFVAIQTPAQLVLAAVLVVHAGLPDATVSVAPVAAALGAAIAVLVAVRLATRR